MKKNYLEFTVGLFVFVGILCIGYLTIKLGKMEIMSGDYYNIVLKFQSVTGLHNGADVEMSGVKIGKVDKIELDEEQYAVVTLKISKRVPITEDAIASIKTAGLIGDKYVRILQGGSEILIKNNERLIETEEPFDLESAISKYALGSVKE